MLAKTLAERDEMILGMHNQILDLQRQVEEKNEHIKKLEGESQDLSDSGPDHGCGPRARSGQVRNDLAPAG